MVTDEDSAILKPPAIREPPVSYAEFDVIVHEFSTSDELLTLIPPPEEPLLNEYPCVITTLLRVTKEPPETTMQRTLFCPSSLNPLPSMESELMPEIDMVFVKYMSAVSEITVFEAIAASS